MAKATELNTTNRRAFLTTMAVAGTAVVAGAVALSPSAEADPIFAAIDTHRNTTIHPLEGDGPYEPGQVEKFVETTVAKSRAALALIATAPTTRAGLRALDAHLRQDNRARWYIRRPGEDPFARLADATASCEEAVNWLIAKRAAEIGAA
jgi:hypothetical protein